MECSSVRFLNSVLSMWRVTNDFDGTLEFEIPHIQKDLQNGIRRLTRFCWLAERVSVNEKRMLSNENCSGGFCERVDKILRDI